jgi:hypothetical protein
MKDLSTNRGDPRLRGRDVSWLWSWAATKNGGRGAGQVTLLFPVAAFAVAITLLFFPYTPALFAAKVLLLSPFPLLSFRHWRGRRGVWSVSALIIAAVPYAILLASLFHKGSASHIPL